MDDIGAVLREARRNVLLLAIAQALIGVVGPMSFAVGGVATVVWPVACLCLLLLSLLMHASRKAAAA